MQTLQEQRAWLYDAYKRKDRYEIKILSGLFLGGVYRVQPPGKHLDSLQSDFNPLEGHMNRF